jgi:putative DNA primase/helicase
MTNSADALVYAYIGKSGRDQIHEKANIFITTLDEQKIRGDERLAQAIVLSTSIYLKERTPDLKTFNKHCEPHLTKDELEYIYPKAKDISNTVKAAEMINGESICVDYRKIADKFIDKGIFLSFNNEIYRYQDGIFKPDNGRLKSEVTAELREAGIGADDRVTTACEQCLHYIKYHNPYPEFPFNPAPDLIPCKNTVLKINFEMGEVKSLDHSPEYRFNYKLNVIYNPKAPTEKIKDYLDSLGVDNQILLQIPAHVILSGLGRVYKKAYFLRGDKDSGKSTFINLITKYFIGEGSYAAISLQGLLYDRFSTAQLIGKIMNAYADLSDQKISDIGKFKALTGGDAINVEKKHQDSFPFINRALMTFSANDYPKIESVDSVFFDRWNGIEFDKKFTVDPEFEKSVFTEENVSGLLLLVIKRITEIIKEGIINTKSIQDKWLASASSAFYYVHECLDRTPNAIIIKKDLMAAYVSFCNDGGLNVQAQKNLTESIKKSGGIEAYPTVGGQREHCYVGFTIKGMEPKYADKEMKQMNINQNIVDTNIIPVQDVQDKMTLRAYGKSVAIAEDVSIAPISSFSVEHPAQLSYLGKSRMELEKVIEQFLPGQPPDAEAFQMAWREAGKQ